VSRFGQCPVELGDGTGVSDGLVEPGQDPWVGVVAGQHGPPLRLDRSGGGGLLAEQGLLVGAGEGAEAGEDARGDSVLLAGGEAGPGRGGDLPQDLRLLATAAGSESGVAAAGRGWVGEVPGAGEDECGLGVGGLVSAVGVRGGLGVGAEGLGRVDSSQLKPGFHR
jgi:hypothetical protein